MVARRNGRHVSDQEKGVVVGQLRRQLSTACPNLTSPHENHTEVTRTTANKEHTSILTTAHQKYLCFYKN